MSSPLTEMIVELVASGRISAAQLQQALDGCAALPRRTHAEHHQRALAQCPAPSQSTYKTNFGRLAERFGQTPLDAVTTAELDELARDVFSQCVAAGGLGVGAQSSFIHSARFFYRVAVTDGVLATNPAAGLVMPRRRRRVRRALVEAELADIYRVVIDSSQDPVLDLLLLDFHRETAARRDIVAAAYRHHSRIRAITDALAPKRLIHGHMHVRYTDRVRWRAAAGAPYSCVIDGLACDEMVGNLIALDLSDPGVSEIAVPIPER